MGVILALISLLATATLPSGSRMLALATRPACRHIEASFRTPHGPMTVLVSGDEYVIYNHYHDSEGSTGRLAALGLEPELGTVDAAFTHPNGSLYLLSDCHYHRYNASSGSRRDRLTFEESGPISSLGLPCDIDAGFSLDSHLFATHGCHLYKHDQLTDRFRRDGLVSDRGLPCHLDAAVEWSHGGAIFIKGTQFWSISDNETSGPFHMDYLNICSWYLCGEADWMRERRRNLNFTCNGDRRFCPLRLNQVTLPGLHNAGAGFDGGFGLFNCWMRNHAQNISSQLQNGIRHLDIDPCYHGCGLLGTCHSFSCGGSICAIIKQVRHFLKTNTDDVITINFNHEIEDTERVFPLLIRQLKTQVGPLLNKRFRSTGSRRWPTLRWSVRANQRLFVFFAPNIEDAPHSRHYTRHRWIHSEDLYGSTWRPFSVNDGCQTVVPLTEDRCWARQYRDLVEVSIVPESTSCVSTTAALCRPYLHQALRACQNSRFRNNASPNVLLVDWPEVNTEDVTSVFHAVYHQNIRNIAHHRANRCQVKIDAAVHIPNTDISLFFVGSRVIEYSYLEGMQVNVSTSANTANIDAAFFDQDSGRIRIFKGCLSWEVHPASLLPVTSTMVTQATCQHADAVFMWNSQLYIFNDCHLYSGQDATPLSIFGLPCHIDATLVANDRVYVFKGDTYWTWDLSTASLEGRTLDWNIDAVQC